MRYKIGTLHIVILIVLFFSTTKLISDDFNITKKVDFFILNIKINNKKIVYETEINKKIFSLDELKIALDKTTRDFTVFLRFNSNKITINDLIPVLLLLKELQISQVVLLAENSIESQKGTVVHIPINLSQFQITHPSNVTMPKDPKPVKPLSVLPKNSSVKIEK